LRNLRDDQVDDHESKTFEPVRASIGNSPIDTADTEEEEQGLEGIKELLKQKGESMRAQAEK
jgi:hypothetical protein